MKKLIYLLAMAPFLVLLVMSQGWSTVLAAVIIVGVILLAVWGLFGLLDLYLDKKWGNNY